MDLLNNLLNVPPNGITDLVISYGLPTGGLLAMAVLMRKWIEDTYNENKKNKSSLEDKSLAADIYLKQQVDNLEKKLQLAMDTIHEIQTARLTDKEEQMEEYYSLMNRFMDLLQNNHKIMETSQLIMKDLHSIINNSNRIIEGYFQSK